METATGRSPAAARAGTKRCATAPPTASVTRPASSPRSILSPAAMAVAVGYQDKTDEQKAITEMVRQFVDKEILPTAEEYDHEDKFPEPIVEQMKELGLFGVTIPEEHGGMGLDLTTYAMIVEELSRGWISISGIVNTHFIGSYLLMKFGTPEQQARLLPKMATGELRAAFSMSEPELGSDVARSPAEMILGGEQAGLNKGFAQMMDALEVGRVNVAARGVGIAQRALELALRYSQERKAFGKPIAQHQAIQFKLADMATQIEAARLLTRKAARLKDAGQSSELEAGMAKLFASEAGRFCVEECFRIHGGYDYSKEYEIERLYRDAPLLLIGEGTSEIQKMVIGKKLLQRHKI